MLPEAPGRLLVADQTALLIIDIQEKLLPAIPDSAQIVRQTGILIEACKLLNVPIVVSEQYVRGLGHTVESLATRLPPQARVLEKRAFGCGADLAIVNAFQSLNRPQILVCGIEAHVCVSQSVHQLMALGYQVHVVEDAIASRHPMNYQTALAKLRQSGAIPTTVETALFELLHTSEHPQFKAVQSLIK